MKKNMLIDGAYPEETRVVLTNDKEIDDFDHETKNKQQIRGNLYLAKVARVEPSLQAAFVDYGKERHGFLSFNEIHLDYFQIPISDRKLLIQKEKELTEKFSPKESTHVDENENIDEEKTIPNFPLNSDTNINFQLTKEREKIFNKYRIQEVIKKGQILLVQVIKEERGNKGAAITTYISLAGRYCVLMANTPRKSGISRRITHSNIRKKLRNTIDSLNIPENMAVIIRTAGEKRTKIEIKRDFNYLLRVWKKIREKTINSMAPVLVHEENNIIKRAIRDLYNQNIDNIYVEGNLAYKAAKDYMKTLIPSKVKIIKSYKEKLPIFQYYNYESKLERMFDPIVHLDSGAYIVINQTEALVAIDVNSGRATKQRNIEETALETNRQAAQEVSRQIKLRNLSGLIIIDFIDMLENKHNRIIENVLKQNLSMDRAKVQVGQISSFGLLEMSRQRIGPSVYEADFQDCNLCKSSGKIRSLESLSLKVLRQIQEKSNKIQNTDLFFKITKDIGINILNNMRIELSDIELRNKCNINIIPDENIKDDCVLIEHDMLSHTKVKDENKSKTVYEENKNQKNIKSKNNRKKNKIVRNSISKSKPYKIVDKKISDSKNKNIETLPNHTSQIIPIKLAKKTSVDKKQEKDKTNSENIKKLTKSNKNQVKKISTKNKIKSIEKKLPAKSGWWNKNI